MKTERNSEAKGQTSASPQRVLITGGSRGIGRACVEYFTAQGCPVVFLYEKNSEAAASVAQSTGAFSLCADIADAAAATETAALYATSPTTSSSATTCKSVSTKSPFAPVWRIVITVEAGAVAVGGCCTTVAEHIRQVVQARERFLREARSPCWLSWHWPETAVPPGCWPPD